MKIKLNVINRDGTQTVINVEEDTTIRDAIEDKIEPESFGLCGGNCNCGTCHVFIHPKDFSKLKVLDDAEYQILKKELRTKNPYTTCVLIKKKINFLKE